MEKKRVTSNDSPELVALLEWNMAVRLMSRDGLDLEARRAAGVLVLKLAPSSYLEMERLHGATGWPPPPPEEVYQAVLAEARGLLTWNREIPEC